MSAKLVKLMMRMKMGLRRDDDVRERERSYYNVWENMKKVRDSRKSRECFSDKVVMQIDARTWPIIAEIGETPDSDKRSCLHSPDMPSCLYTS